MILIPLFFVFRESFFSNDTGRLTNENWIQAFQGENLKAIGNSLLLALLVTLLSSLLALPLSYFLSRTRLRKAWWLGILMMVPFMVPPYINSLAWMLFMQRNGVVWRLLPALRPLCDRFYSLFGMVWIMSMHTFPFLTTLLISAMDTFPNSLEEASRLYSRSRLKSFFRIDLPILLPNYLIGAFLVFVKAMSEYGTPATFGLQINYTVFTTLITDKMQVSPINFHLASSLASVMVMVCLVVWALETYVVRKRSYPLIPNAEPNRNSSRAVFVLGLLFCLLLHLFSATIPLLTLLLTSFKKVSYYNLSEPGNFTGSNYVVAFTEDQGFGTGLEALKNTVVISLLSALLVFLLGMLLGTFARRYRTKTLGKAVDLLSTLPQMLPNIVTGIGLIFLYNGISKAVPLYRTPAMLVIGYSVILLPGMFSYVKSALTQMPESLLEAGEVFSRSKAKTDFFVIFPMALKGSLYGFVMTLIVAFRELVTAKLLQPPHLYTLSLYIDFQFNQGNQMPAIALSIVSVAITLAVLLPLEFAVKGRKRKVGR